MIKKILICFYIFWIIIFILVPVWLIFYYGFTVLINNKIIFSLENFKRAFELVYLKILFRSVTMAGSCTFVCLLLGYPVAYILANKKLESNSSLIFLFLLPMWLNMLLRTYAWMTLLEKNGLINSCLKILGFNKLDLIYNKKTITFGMSYNFLPFMILPVYNSLKKINISSIEAAQDLGANYLVIFYKIILPLSMPGILSGITMVFMPALTSFVIPNLLGGGKFMLIGNLIEMEFVRVSDWHFGSALALMLLFIIILFEIIFYFMSRDHENKNSIF